MFITYYYGLKVINSQRVDERETASIPLIAKQKMM